MRFLIVLLLCIPTLTHAQDEDAPPPPPPCSDPAYRQFDFWIGEWNVTSNGQPAGTNRIRKIHGGCALEENWQGAGAGGISGSSFNIYDQANERWHQTWVDAGGTLLQIDGGLNGGAMVMSGERPSPDGSGRSTHRITWTPNPDGTVRQLWEASRDGQTWSVLFDGLYTRVASGE
ncbi:hypothetical protein [Elongatibacter sediminis]|uniref:DUF1579 domain-containing protein n=1 Tax=Elongatibacter sediminis TaxID=3119006 RepID=A0AAW9RE59_9GAMM